MATLTEQILYGQIKHSYKSEEFRQLVETELANEGWSDKTKNILWNKSVSVSSHQLDVFKNYSSLVELINQVLAAQ